MDRIEQRDRFLGLVRLQRADQVELDVRKAIPELAETLPFTCQAGG